MCLFRKTFFQNDKKKIYTAWCYFLNPPTSSQHTKVKTGNEMHLKENPSLPIPNFFVIQMFVFSILFINNNKIKISKKQSLSIKLLYVFVMFSSIPAPSNPKPEAWIILFENVMILLLYIHWWVNIFFLFTITISLVSSRLKSIFCYPRLVVRGD